METDDVLDFEPNQHNKSNGLQGEAQYLFQSERVNLTAGAGKYDVEKVRRAGTASEKWEIDQVNYYAYSNIVLPHSATWTVGISFDHYQDHASEADVQALNPKIGLRCKVAPDAELRFAAFQTVKRALLVNRTVEPTQVAGFNQFFDDLNGTKSRQYGVGLDVRLITRLYAGAEMMRRHMSLMDTTENYQENISRIYLYWPFHPDWATSAEFEFDRFHGFVDMDTVSVPLFVRYFDPIGLFGGIGATFVHHDVRRLGSSSTEGNITSWSWMPVLATACRSKEAR